MLERLLGFVFTFINFRTGMFALVLYFLATVAPSYVHFYF